MIKEIDTIELHKEIAKNYNLFYKYAFKICGDKNEVNEVVQELYLYLLNMNQQTLIKIYDKDNIKGIVGYGCIVIKRSLISKKSQYYYKINKYYEKISSLETSRSNKDRERIREYLEQLPDIEKDETQESWYKLEQIDQALDKMYWYDRDIFKLKYYEAGNTLDSLAAKTRISRNSLFTTIDKVRTELRYILNTTNE